MFVVPKHIAHKMVKTRNFVSQKAFINFRKLQSKTNQAKKFKKKQKTWKIALIWAQKLLKMTF